MISISIKMIYMKIMLTEISINDLIEIVLPEHDLHELNLMSMISMISIS